MPSTKDKLEFVHAMARHTRASVRQCEALMRYAATLHRLADAQCNREWTERDESKRTSVVRKVVNICVELSGPQTTGPAGYVVPVHSRDPRGAVLKIRVPDGFSNSFGGEGIVVPS